MSDYDVVQNSVTWLDDVENRITRGSEIGVEGEAHAIELNRLLQEEG
jgi:hypothetical protein